MHIGSRRSRGMVDCERRDSSGSRRQFPDCRCRADRRPPGRRRLCPRRRLGRPAGRNRKPSCLVRGCRNLAPPAVPAGRADCRHRPGRVCPGQSLAQADACLGGRLAQILRAGGSSRRGIGGRLHRRAAARRCGAAAANPATLDRPGRCRSYHCRRRQITLFGIAANRVPGALRSSGGVGTRLLARHRRGDRRRYAARDIAALERRAGIGGSAANRFGHPDLPPVCMGGMATQTHNGGRRCRAAPEKPLADPPCQTMAGNRDRVS